MPPSLPGPPTTSCFLVLAWGEDEAFDYLKELHKNIQSYTQSGTAPSQAVAIGQAGVAISLPRHS